MNDNCVFCKIIKGEVPSYKLYEDAKTLAFLDIHPSSIGHTLIIPKRHVQKIEELSENEAKDLFRTLHLLVKPIQTAVKASASTIGINNGPDSGQEIPHLHVHIIPRSKGDGGGIIQGILRIEKGQNGEKMYSLMNKIRILI